LGLSVVYGLVAENHGRITVDSKPGRGTTVQIYWPQCESPSATTEEAGVRRMLPRGTETILLVEDFDGLRQTTRAFLEMEGYKVLEAANGAEAIWAVQQYAGKIDLLLTDVIMPGMSGVHLAQRIAILRPGITILFVSGYAADVLDSHEIARPALIEKPFTFDALAQKIRDLLDSAESQSPAATSSVSK
jgi:DNA-binding response OmpR family regulator